MPTDAHPPCGFLIVLGVQFVTGMWFLCPLPAGEFRVLVLRKGQTIVTVATLRQVLLAQGSAIASAHDG